MTENKRFVKYDGNTIVDLKLVKSWIISNGNVELLLEILNNEKTSKKEIIRKRCTDCKHTKGIGIDFWCGEGHTEYEVFIGKTNCPYFEYHDWSKGTPSRTEKRFSQKDEDDGEILDRNKHFAYAHSGYQAEKIIQELNELVETNRALYKENKQLKQQINELQFNKALGQQEYQKRDLE